MKILLNQRYGLGNQLFQYTAGLYYAKKYNAPLEIIRQPDHAVSSFGHARPFMLSRFNVATPIRDRTYLDRILRSDSTAIAVVASPIRAFMGAYSHDPERLIIGDFVPSLPLPRGTKRVYLNGHFQAYAYAEAVEDRIRSEFTLREAPAGKNLDTLNQIRDTECPVSLHVRYGDYAKEWAGTNLLPMTYYPGAIAMMSEKQPNATYYVFSDDIAFARQNLPPLKRVVFVENNDESNAHEDLRLMSACRHHILANSSFSWWGAWLNPNPDKIVLVPQPWHVVSPHPDLIPPTWHQVPTQPAVNI